MAADAWTQIPREYAHLQQLSPADLRRWVITHSTVAANQIEAERDRQPEPGE